MSILIKGMKMPKNCENCLFEKNEHFEGKYCVLTGRHDFKMCPLIEIPPHGRLIDADELEKSLINWGTEETSSIYWNDIACAPTVIEAESDGLESFIKHFKD